jgi:azurin
MTILRLTFPMAMIFVAAVTLLDGNAALAAADSCSVAVSAGDDMVFDRKEIVIPRSCKKAQVTLKNTGTLPIQVMGHNWVLVREKDLDAFLRDAVSSGPSLDYIPPNDPRVIAHTKLLAGGESGVAEVDLKALHPGEPLIFVCSYPGHGASMRGSFIIK